MSHSIWIAFGLLLKRPQDDTPKYDPLDPVALNVALQAEAEKYPPLSRNARRASIILGIAAVSVMITGIVLAVTAGPPEPHPGVEGRQSEEQYVLAQGTISWVGDDDGYPEIRFEEDDSVLMKFMDSSARDQIVGREGSQITVACTEFDDPNVLDWCELSSEDEMDAELISDLDGSSFFSMNTEPDKLTKDRSPYVQ